MSQHQQNKDNRIWRFNELQPKCFEGTALEAITTDLYSLIDSFTPSLVGPLKAKYEWKQNLILRADQPWNVAMGRKGEYLITEHAIHQIVIYDSEGIKLKTIGRRTELGELDHPIGIAVDHRNGDFAVSEYGACRIQLFNEQGVAIKLIGSGRGREPGQLSGPYDVAITREGNFAVADMSCQRIQVFDRNGDYLMKIEDTPLPFQVPTGLKVDPRNGNFVIFQNDTVFLFSPDGTKIKQIKGSWGAFSGGIDGAGHYVIANRIGGTIVVLNTEGQEIMQLGVPLRRVNSDNTYPPPEPYHLASPYSCTVDRQGNIVVVDTGNNRVMVWG